MSISFDGSKFSKRSLGLGGLLGSILTMIVQYIMTAIQIIP